MRIIGGVLPPGWSGILPVLMLHERITPVGVLTRSRLNASMHIGRKPNDRISLTLIA